MLNHSYSKRIKPICNRVKLYAAKDGGGLSLPRLDWYHYSFSLVQLPKYNLLSHRVPAWVEIEKDLINSFQIETFVTQASYSCNPILEFLRESWKMSYSYIKSNPSLTYEASIWFNSKVRIVKEPFCWYQWAKVGVLCLGDLYDNAHIVTFEHLKQKYNLANTEFWKYLQLHHCLNLKFKKGA